jgi:hypothetical protein
MAFSGESVALDSNRNSADDRIAQASQSDGRGGGLC